MTMTATVRTNSNVQPCQTLASQIDRLDGIRDGLDAALAGTVQEARGLSTTVVVPRMIEPSSSKRVWWLLLNGDAEVGPAGA
jgi:hypothetical protein